MIDLLRIILIRLLALVLALAAPISASAEDVPYEQPPIHYSAAAPDDPVARLQKRIEQGGIQFESDDQFGYLPALLRELKISESSQTLVFSKTSFQRSRISPRAPRAIYFNDETYIGVVQGGMIEIATTDPKLGTIFYTVRGRGGDGGPPRLSRQIEACLQCHGGSRTRHVPGVLLRSVFPDESGDAIFSAGTFLTTHESPFEQRWGGWYVTGTTTQKHLGNTTWRKNDDQDPEPLIAERENLPDISGLVDTSKYLTPHSDIVALLVLEHQVETHNRFTRAAHAVQRALWEEKLLQSSSEKSSGTHSDSAIRRVKKACEPLVQYLLFSGEAPLTGPVKGSSSFTSDFQSLGPRDSRNRSLRDFDLNARLFRYPCSYLIYSDAFHGLPELAKQYIYQRMWEVLSGSERGKEFSHLTAANRKAVIEILRDTKPDLPDYWKAQSVQ